MTFATLWMLHFFWLLPLVIVGLIMYQRRKRRALALLADCKLLPRLIAPERKGMPFFKGLLLLSALALLIIALAGPRWGSYYQEVFQKGVDIMIVFDVSPSMLVEDVKPTRLEQARREVLDFLQVVKGDRLGLIAFSGSAFVQCPLTLDYAALEMFLGQLNPDLIPVPGTDLGDAIDVALNSFDPEAATDRVIMLITDGEDNEGRGLEAARKAGASGVKIFVFGIGRSEGGPVPGEKGGFAKDDAGKIVLSKLDEESLRQIAGSTGGVYVRALSGDFDLDVIYFTGIRSRTQAAELKSGKIKVYEERFSVFIVAALMLLLIEGMIRERHLENSTSRSKIL